MRIHIKTYGCTHNQADSERMAGLLTRAGHTIVDAPDTADLLLVNSCHVKGPSESRFWHDLQQAKGRGRPVVAAGCVPQAMTKDERLARVPIVGVKEIERVVEVVEAAGHGRRIQHTSRTPSPSLTLPRLRRNPLVEIIPISDGCLGSCTYCSTLLARGRLKSHARQEIANAIRAATRQGAKEIWITSEDVGAWGKERGETLPELLKAIASIPGDFMVRIGMANPPFMKAYVDEMIALLAEFPERFFRSLHIPVQSGSNAVLEHMNREYLVEDFQFLVDKMRTAFPEMTLMTDYIVGYPTETEEDFEATLALAAREECRILNINKFYPRPGTKAMRLQKLPTTVVAERCKRLVALYESYNPNEHLLGTEHEVLVTERGKGDSLVGHNRDYVQVVLPKAPADVLGTWQCVRITETNKYYLVGEVTASPRRT